MASQFSKLLLVLVDLLAYGASPFPISAAKLQASSGACASHYQTASAQSAVDGKTLVGLRIQEQHTKFNVTSAVSDFEKSLSRENASECKRQLANAGELWLNGSQATGCQDLLENTGHSETGGKLKVRNEIVDVAYPEAHVTLDALPRNEHHTYLLENVHEKWVIRCFASSPIK